MPLLDLRIDDPRLLATDHAMDEAAVRRIVLGLTVDPACPAFTDTDIVAAGRWLTRTELLRGTASDEIETMKAVVGDAAQRRGQIRQAADRRPAPQRGGGMGPPMSGLPGTDIPAWNRRRYVEKPGMSWWKGAWLDLQRKVGERGDWEVVPLRADHLRLLGDAFVLMLPPGFGGVAEKTYPDVSRILAHRFGTERMAVALVPDARPSWARPAADDWPGAKVADREMARMRWYRDMGRWLQAGADGKRPWTPVPVRAGILRLVRDAIRLAPLPMVPEAGGPGSVGCPADAKHLAAHRWEEGKA